MVKFFLLNIKYLFYKYPRVPVDIHGY